MKAPYNYLRFIHMFPKLSEDEQLRLLSILASPSKVRSAMRQLTGEMYNVRKAVRCFTELVNEVMTNGN